MSTPLFEVAVLSPYTQRQNEVGQGLTNGNSTYENDDKKRQVPGPDQVKSSSLRRHSENFQLDLVHTNLCQGKPEQSSQARQSDQGVTETAESVNGYSSMSSMSCWSSSGLLASDCSWLWGGDSQLTQESVVTNDVFLSADENLAEFHSLNFTPVTYIPCDPSTQMGGQIGVDNINLDINFQPSNIVADLSENIQQSSLDNVLANIAEGIYHLEDTEESVDTFNQLFRLDLHPVDSTDTFTDAEMGSGNDLESVEFYSAVSDAFDPSELYLTGLSGLNRTDDGCGSAFSSCHGSRSSSSCDFIDSKRGMSEDSLADVEFDYSGAITKERRLTRKKVSKVQTMVHTPPARKLETSKPAQWKSFASAFEDTESSWDTSHGDSSGCNPYETSNPSLVSTASGQSELNPHSKPFIPRAHLNIYKSGVLDANEQLNYSHTERNLHLSQFNETKHVNHNINFSDSGFGNTTDITAAWDTTDNTREKSLTRTMDDSAFPITTPAKKDSFKNNYETKVATTTKTIRLTDCHTHAAVELDPYDCKLNHENDFVPIQSFSSYKLPQEIRTTSNAEAILSISHRVVKLTVSKPCKARSHCQYDLFFEKDESTPCYDHLGTGFVFQVDKENVFIRTHTEVVASSEEAAKTKVSLVITFPGGKQSSQIHCVGEEEGFETSVHSQACVFRCKTPKELLPYLYLLREVPILNRSSLFNDSCYFTDSSPDSSAVERDETDQEMKWNCSSLDESSSKANYFKRSSNIEPHHVVTSGIHRPNEKTDILNSIVQISNRQENLGQKNGNVHSEFDGNMNTSDYHKTRGDKMECQKDKHEIKLEKYNDNCFSYFCQDTPITTTPDMDQIMDFVTYCPGAQTVWPCSYPMYNTTENPFAYCGVEESEVRQAFESRESFEYPSAQSIRKMNLSKCDNNFAVPNPVVPGKQSSNSRRLQANKTSSPLVIMENKADARRKANNLDTCPYNDETIFGSYGVYSYFSSHAGDIFSSIQTLNTPTHNLSPYASLPDYCFWEYEGLVHAQNHDRSAYERLYKPTTHWDLPQAVNQDSSWFGQNWTESPKDKIQGCSDTHQSFEQGFKKNHLPNIWEQRLASSTAHQKRCSDSLSITDTSAQTGNFKYPRDVFAEFTSLETYLGTWDRDLLTIEDDIDPLPDFGDFEAMLNQLVAESETEDEGTRACCQKVAVSGKDARKTKHLSRNVPLFALIISHPHGGSKMVSTGVFSRHHHVGGDLYDVPTCMGSCGAPIVAFNDGGGPYVTHLVHAGTTRVNDIYSGVGITFF